MEETELMSFSRTIKVLAFLADDVRAGYIDQLKKHGHPTQYGKDRLHETITTQVEVDGKKFTASLNMNKYWEYLEYGTKAHWPPLSAIEKWIDIKRVIPRPDDYGRIPSTKSLAFLIGRAMAGQSQNQATLKNPHGGTTGTHGFETARDAILPMYYEKIEQALAEDIGDYVKMYLTW